MAVAAVVVAPVVEEVVVVAPVAVAVRISLVLVMVLESKSFLINFCFFFCLCLTKDILLCATASSKYKGSKGSEKTRQDK